MRPFSMRRVGLTHQPFGLRRSRTIHIVTATAIMMPILVTPAAIVVMGTSVHVACFRVNASVARPNSGR